MMHPCLQHFMRHWSFCLEALCSVPRSVLKALQTICVSDTTECFLCLKGSDAIGPFLWTGLGCSLWQHKGWQVKHSAVLKQWHVTYYHGRSLQIMSFKDSVFRLSLLVWDIAFLQYVGPTNWEHSTLVQSDNSRCLRTQNTLPFAQHQFICNRG